MQCCHLYHTYFTRRNIQTADTGRQACVGVGVVIRDPGATRGVGGLGVCGVDIPIVVIDIAVAVAVVISHEVAIAVDGDG